MDIEEAHAVYALGAEEGPAAREALLEWWDASHRAMPWRREDDGGSLTEVERRVWAYRVWVSEVMLQQTQVDRVVPYFTRWVDKWPTVEALAAADIDETRALWSGLGYYRRCQFLLEGARGLAAAKIFPTTRDEWLAVKGVGAYTAAAIASIVFGERVPVVDGNVIRVLSRLRACPEVPTGRVGSKLWWLLAAEMVGGRERAGDVNQAMMELGATVCTKANPQCASACPLGKVCRGRREFPEDARALAAAYPTVAPKKAAKRIDAVVCVVEAASLQKFVLIKPPVDAAVFKIEGLWELPGARMAYSDDALGEFADNGLLYAAVDAALKKTHRVLRENAPPPRRIRKLREAIAHTITSSKYVVHVVHVQVAHDDDLLISAANDVVLVDQADLAHRGASSFVAKAIGAVFPPSLDDNPASDDDKEEKKTHPLASSKRPSKRQKKNVAPAAIKSDDNDDATRGSSSAYFS